MVGLQVASAVGGVMAQKQAADAQSDANMRQWQAAVKARNQNFAQSNLQQLQEVEAAGGKIDENNMKARAAAATARVAAGESGVSGLSVDALLGDISSKQNRYNTSVMTNYDRKTNMIDLQRENSNIDMVNTINSLKTPAAPDYLGAALRIGQAVYGYQNAGGGSQYTSGASTATGAQNYLANY